MNANELTRAVFVDGKAYQRHADGSLTPISDMTDDAGLDALSADDIDAMANADPDAVPMSDEAWLTASLKTPEKMPVGIKLDRDVVEWFKAQGGRGYQTRINAVLRRYMEAHRKAL
jgi:uncharacterized protein (DUF4415 family)